MQAAILFVRELVYLVCQSEQLSIMASEAPTTTAAGPQDESCTGEDACMEPQIFEMLLPDTIIKILKMLSDTPEAIVTFGLTCSLANDICSDDSLWLDLCKCATDTFPSQLRSQDWSPAAWRVGSYRELYISLLLPYWPLLQHRYWHTTKMSAGQLLVIDAYPPCVVASSVFYKRLQGPAFSHPIFIIRLPDKGRGKARVYCCSCRHDAAGVQVVANPPGTTVLAVKRPADAGPMPMQSSSNLFSARLAFLQPSSQVPEADEPNSTAGSSATGSVDHQQAEATGVEGSPAFSLCCGCSCGNLYAEQMARWHRSRPHSSTSAFTSCSSSRGGVAADQQASVAPAPSPAGAADVGPGSSGDITGGSLLLPLPDVGEYRMSHWDLRYFVDDLDLPEDWRSQAVYQPLVLSTWRQLPASTGTAAAAADSTTSIASSAAAAEASSSSSHLQPGRLAAAPPAVVDHSAAALVGLWRGTYGAHGVELAHVQLLLAPPGFDLLQNHQIPAAPPLEFAQCPKGVLLQSLLHTPPPQRPPRNTSAGGAAMLGGNAAAGPGEAPGEEPLPAEPEAPAVASAADAAVGDGSSSEQQQLQAQPLLLVATKVLGDRNVPAGQVTFAVDLSSRSTEGAGRQLELPPTVYSDVRMNGPDTRPLIIKERYSGLAQIAEAYFHIPKILCVELLVFEGEDCLGLMWKAPMDSFSLLSRVHSLP